MPYGKTIELFLVNGTADSIITAELSNWNGKAIKIPRIELQSCMREDITRAGVFFLFCREEDDSDSVYIGESENVKERLLQHIRDYQADKEKYYWTTTVIFTGRNLNKTLRTVWLRSQSPAGDTGSLRRTRMQIPSSRNLNAR
jgi:hypothetical protein